MNEENNGMVTPQNKAKTELQKALQKIPDDILLAAIADRIKRTPDEKFKAVVQTVISQQIFSGPIPPRKYWRGMHLPVLTLPSVLSKWRNLNNDICRKWRRRRLKPQ